MTTSTLRGDRVVLELLRPEHARRLRALRDAPEVARRWDPAPDGWPLAVEEGIDAKLTITVDGEVAGFVQYAEDAATRTTATRTSTYSWDPAIRTVASEPTRCGSSSDICSTTVATTA